MKKSILAICFLVTAASALANTSGKTYNITPRYNEAQSSLEYIQTETGKVLYSESVSKVLSDDGSATLVNTSGKKLGTEKEFSDKMNVSCQTRRAIGRDPSSPKVACERARMVLNGCSNIQTSSADMNFFFQCNASGCCD